MANAIQNYSHLYCRIFPTYFVIIFIVAAAAVATELGNGKVICSTYIKLRCNNLKIDAYEAKNERKNTKLTLRDRKIEERKTDKIDEARKETEEQQKAKNKKKQMPNRTEQR